MVSACMSSTEALADWAWLESDLLPKMQVLCASHFQSHKIIIVEKRNYIIACQDFETASETTDFVAGKIASIVATAQVEQQ